MNNQNNGNNSDNVAGGIMGIVFMIVWLYKAISGGASFIAVAFGVFGLFSIARTTYHHFKIRQQNKNGSQYDMYGDYRTEPNNMDPWGVNYPAPREICNTDIYGNPLTEGDTKNFCPYCGIAIKDDHAFCKNCGRQLPD